MEPKRFLDRILEAAIVLAASAYLIKLAACYLTQSWPTLAIIAVLITAAMIGFQVWKHHRDQYW